MRRVPLKETGIEDLKAFDWISYFEYNNSHLLKLDFSNPQALTDEELKLILPSVKAFQIGEGSQGRHLTKCVKKFAEKSGYKEYAEIMRWFVLEENRHSQTLKRFLEVYNIEPVSKMWLDSVFRLLRKLTGLEWEVIVLVTAEMIALPYYTALSHATGSQLLKTVCEQMLNDELKHIVLQSDTLNRISAGRGEFRNCAVRIIRKILMSVTAFIVWHKYKALFLKGGYPYRIFKNHCREYLSESIYIEKNGTVLQA